VPAFLAPPVYVLRVPHVQHVEGAGKRLRVLRHADKMHVVVHEAVGPYIKPVFAAIGLQPFQILDKILICLKDGLPVIASLGYMMRISFGYGSRYSWHVVTLVFLSLLSK
jgi:hypothetical protein